MSNPNQTEQDDTQASEQDEVDSRGSDLDFEPSEDVNHVHISHLDVGTDNYIIPPYR